MNIDPEIQHPITSFKGILSLIQAFPILSYLISFLKDLVISIMKTGPVPTHVAVIMDGNRTFARTNNLSLEQGHIAGAHSLVHVLDTCYRVGVKHVTIYAFSIENFNRSKEEVDTLFSLLRERLQLLSHNEESFAIYNKIKIKIIGNKSMIPEDILHDLTQVELKTKHNSSHKVLNVCFPYTSRDDISHCIQAIVEDTALTKKIKGSDLNLSLLTANMYYGPDTPPLDILIRTSGQTRLSDFMLWQCNYNCTIEFVDTLWPDFTFIPIVFVLLKWGYYKTMESIQKASAGKPTVKTERNVLQELNPPPPHKSVTSR